MPLDPVLLGFLRTFETTVDGGMDATIYAGGLRFTGVMIGTTTAFKEHAAAFAVSADQTAAHIGAEFREIAEVPPPLEDDLPDDWCPPAVYLRNASVNGEPFRGPFEGMPGPVVAIPIGSIDAWCPGT